MATDIFITPTSGTVDFNNGVFGSVLGTIATMKVYDNLTSGNLSIQNSATSNLSGVKFLNRGNPGNVFEAYGTYGNLFTISDDLTDSIFSINNSAGLPVFDVYSNNSVYAGQYASGDFTISGNKIGIGTKTPSSKLEVNGSLIAGGVNNGSVIFYRSTNPATIGSTDAVLYVSDRSNSDWGITIDKTGFNYGLKIIVSASSPESFVINNGSTNPISFNGNGNGIFSGTVTAASFAGALTGNVTGNVSGSSGSCTGNAATATTAAACTGNAATVTTNANLTGHITSVGNATSLGSFTSAQLLAALTDETGTGANVFANSPTLVSPVLGTPSSGNLANCTFPTLNQNTTGTSSNITAYTINQNVGTANTPKFLNVYGERATVTSAASTTVNTQYNVTELTMSASITTLTLSNIQASTIVHMWTIVTVGNSTTYSIIWPAAIKWPGGTAPTITATNAKRDIYQFVTYDGGTNIYAIIVGQNL